MASAQRVAFTGSGGDPLAARLDLPLGPIRSYALFAHCFTCSKDVFAAQRIASELALRGIAVLRFDFTGSVPPAGSSRTAISRRTWRISDARPLIWPSIMARPKF
jgi:hypothetical protein